jgi:hypothetical protein
MNLIDIFERIYIVNLPERSDRRQEMDEELANIGLKVDGQRIRYFRAIRPENAGEFPSLGSRGCFMSHLAILNEAIKDGLSNILIMEDDLSPDIRCKSIEPAMVQRLQAGNWHFAYFGHVEKNESESPVWRENLEPMATTHFYALNGSVLKPLRDHLEACLKRPLGHPQGSPMHVDGAYSLFRQQQPNIITLMADPSLGGQRSSRSDIFPNKWYDRIAFTRQLASIARSVKNRFFRRNCNPL